MIPFYIGTYTSGLSQGIYRALLNPQTGRIENLELAARIDNPTFLAIHPTLPRLYACSEIRRDGKREGAKVAAFQIETTGQLTALGHQLGQGSGPCYVATDRTGKVALVANYASGSISSLPIAPDGTLGSIVSNIQHTGHSVDPLRQEGPHAHCILPDPSNRFVCAVDLGLDQVLVYKLDTGRAELSRCAAGHFQATAGHGPRHLAFHPDGRHAFIIHEMGNTITTARWDSQAGAFTTLSTIGTLPADFHGENTTAEIQVHPNGRWVYGSNRGHDSIAVYAFDAASGTLELLQHISTEGKTPRNFCLDPAGQFLLAENQDSDSIVVFRIDAASGRLSPTGYSATVGKPCCIKFAH